MDWQGLGAAVGGLGAVVGGVRQFSGKGARIRSRIAHDMDLLGKLEPESLGHAELQQHIDQSVRNLVAHQQDQDSRQTDPYGFIWLVIFIGIAAGAAVTAVRTGYAWWVDLALWVVVGVLAVLTMAGAAVTFRQAPKKASSADKS